MLTAGIEAFRFSLAYPADPVCANPPDEPTKCGVDRIGSPAPGPMAFVTWDGGPSGPSSSIPSDKARAMAAATNDPPP
jgi:hypothetical protein